MSSNYFTFPYYQSSGSGPYGTVLRLKPGQIVPIAFESNLTFQYDLVLYHQLLNVAGGSGVQVVPVTSFADGEGNGSITYNWNVTTYDTDFNASPVYFFWANPGVNGFTSSYFNITNSALDSSSSSISISTSTSTTASSSSSSTTAGTSPTTAGSATSTTSTAATSTSTSSSSSSSLSIGLGVGLGVGIPLLLAIGAWIGIMMFRRRKSPKGAPRQEASSAGPHGARYGALATNYSEKNQPSYQPEYQTSQQYKDSNSPQGPHEMFAGQNVYEAPGRDHGGPTSPVEIGSR